MMGCYAIAFDNGTVKFGRSDVLFSRIKSHIHNARTMGVGVEMILVAHTRIPADMEGRLLMAASGIFEKSVGEFFRYKDVDDIKRVMARVFDGFFTVEAVRHGGASFLSIVDDGPSVYVTTRGKMKAEDPLDVICRKALSVVSRNNGITYGVLQSRLRNIDSGALRQAVDTLISSGALVLKIKVHPKNGSEIARLYCA